MSDPRFRSATDIAKRVRARELSAVAVLDEQLAQIRKHNPALNAVVELLEESARTQALAADHAAREGRNLGPLHGVPVLLKDVHRMRDSLSTYGLPQFKHYRPQSDSWVAERLRDAGAVIVGRTNVPVAGFDWQTWNSIYGASNNPWDFERTPGGSSGGAAAAVAAGFVPLDIGSDLGGSIRYPAHCCGVYGLRPSEGLVPNWRLQAERHALPFRHMLTSGPIARSLDDIELGLRVITPAGFASLPSPAPLARPLRIGWTDRYPGLNPVLGKESRKAFLAYVERLRAAGHTVESVLPEGVDFYESMGVWGSIVGHEFVAGLPAFVRPWPLRALFLGALTMRFFFGAGRFSESFTQGFLSGRQAYFRALSRRDEMMMDFQRLFSRYDAWITPVAPDEAPLKCRMGTSIEREGRNHTYSEYFASWTVPLTPFGHPILTLPIARMGSGLPISVQVSGPRFGDLQLIAIGRQLAPHGLPVEIPPAFAAAKPRA